MFSHTLSNIDLILFVHAWVDETFLCIQSFKEVLSNFFCYLIYKYSTMIHMVMVLSHVYHMGLSWSW
jgi:hypothetical protein